MALNEILQHLLALYGDDAGHATFTRLQSLLSKYPPHVTAPRSSLTEREAILITYGDQVREPNIPPLRTLADFCARHLAGVVNTIHILPFYPYSSDDGFSVIDHRAVNPVLGDWNDIARIGASFRLMFDAVINHVSSQSAWFKGFLRDDPRFRDYFIVVPDGADVSRVIRPRNLPLLTTFETPSGAKKVWTTFSADQVDLNYANPEVLLEIVDTLLLYVARGAEFIRLDAIAFLWKELGTSCLHLPQTHRIIQCFRAILDETAPQVSLITETNVPHAHNISYFGNGWNEAHLVYNFALPPLVLNAFHTGDARTLTQWASELRLPSHGVTFLNFLASHDGIGLNPVRGILNDREIDALVTRTEQYDGFVSYKNNPDGTSSPYELNINYFDALSDPKAAESPETQIDRFITAQAIMLSLLGVPAIYFHSMFGSTGWPQGVQATGHNRAINREKCDRGSLERELANAASRRQLVFTRYRHLLRIRTANAAFDPYGAMQILDFSPSVFSVLRFAPSHSPVLCLHNVSNRSQSIELNLPHELRTLYGLVDLITGQRVQATGVVHLAPYQSLWLTVSFSSS